MARVARPIHENSRMIRLIYNLLFPLALLFFLPAYVVKMLRRGNYRNKFGQRLGFYDRSDARKAGPGRATWLHAVSVGEVMIALKLATKMQEREPSLRIALTTTTTTGFALASREAPDWIEVLYTPLDFWPIMRRAFAAHPANPYRPRRSRSLAEPDRDRASAKNSHSHSSMRASRRALSDVSAISICSLGHIFENSI